MQDLMTINVLIGDRTYRIKIDPKDEETVRKTLKTINNQIMEFKSQFSGKDTQDYLAMVLLWYATQSAGASEEEQATENGAQATLRKLEEQLDRVL
jgi:cell division protein ZapA (FtsZ GTPase activity inhibitor)